MRRATRGDIRPLLSWRQSLASRRSVKSCDIDTSAPDFGDPTVRYVEIASDSALEVDGDDGLTLIVNDLIGDIHGEGGLGGWLLRVMGFAGDEPHVPGPVKLLLGKHKSEVADSSGAGQIARICGGSSFRMATRSTAIRVERYENWRRASSEPYGNSRSARNDN